MRSLILLNIIFLFILRFLLKNNLFLKSVGYFSLVLQGLVLISFPFRDRSFLDFWLNVDFVLLFLLFLSLIPIAVPFLINLFISEKKKLALAEIEEKLLTFCDVLLRELQEFLTKNFYFYSRIETFFIENLTKAFLKLLIFEELLFLLFFVVPWLFFIISLYSSLYFQVGYSKVFIFLVYGLFFSRILSICLFLVRTYLWNNFNDFVWVTNKKFYSCITPFTDFILTNPKVLNELVFDDSLEILQKDNHLASVDFWKQFNIYLYLFINYALIKNFQENLFPKVRTLFYWLNFFSIGLGIMFSYSFILGTFLLLIIIFFCSPIFKNILQKENDFDQKLFVFLQTFDHFYFAFQQRLIKERGFSPKEASSCLVYRFPKFPSSIFDKTNLIFLFPFMVFFPFLAFLFFVLDLKEMTLISDFNYLHQAIKNIFINIFSYFSNNKP